MTPLCNAHCAQATTHAAPHIASAPATALPAQEETHATWNLNPKHEQGGQTEQHADADDHRRRQQHQGGASQDGSHGSTTSASRAWYRRCNCSITSGGRSGHSPSIAPPLTYSPHPRPWLH